MRVLVIVNPAAGADVPILATLQKAFAPLELEWRVRVTNGDGDAARFAREARAHAADDVVAVCGGDGTLNEVASQWIGEERPLAIFPCGTGNALAQELGIPLDLEAAARLAVDPDRRSARIDAIDLDGRISLLRVGIGADAHTIAQADRESKDRLGWLAYLKGALSQLPNPPSARYRIVVDGEAFEQEAATCVILNSGRIGFGGLSLAKPASPLDGLLDLLLVRDAGLSSLSAIGASVVGKLEPKRVAELVPGGALHYVRGRELEVDTDPPQERHADGEVLPPGRVRARVLAAALAITLPGAGPALERAATAAPA